MSNNTITHAMVLAAGLGERMRPLTDNTPKPMLHINGRALIDYAIDRVEDAGIPNVVVNTFYLAEKLEDHLSKRQSPKINFSREPERLETGGGVLHARKLLGEGPFLVINGDALWLNGPDDTLKRMQRIWNPDTMDALLLMHSTVEAYGYSGRGDFLVGPRGKLTRRPENEICPYMFAGIQILHPRLFSDFEDGKFSLNKIYDKGIENNRLYGIVHDGEWFHVGTPEALEEIEAFMKERYAGVQHR
ncbi:MAG: nucleotidyltransferase family protein [Rhodospirillales bacterium]|jgi:N-acetyl-alpha-D-muramate 1-phosphate uridylyltransferase|nr:nucleotidyltransferase family protein [Rhodospirillales bacterium]